MHMYVRHKVSMIKPVARRTVHRPTTTTTMMAHNGHFMIAKVLWH